MCTLVYRKRDAAHAPPPVTFTHRNGAVCFSFYAYKPRCQALGRLHYICMPRRKTPGPDWSLETAVLFQMLALENTTPPFPPSSRNAPPNVILRDHALAQQCRLKMKKVQFD